MEADSVLTPVLLMARYNVWANNQFELFFGTQPEELITQFVPGSFPSIQKTLLHIWDAQDIWYRRLHGESPSALLSASWTGRLNELYAGIAKTSVEHLELVQSLSAEESMKVMRYTTISSGQQESRRYEILLHVFNHSMYHRGQCVTMARTLDMQSIPSTDLIRYLRIQGSTDNP